MGQFRKSKILQLILTLSYLTACSSQELTRFGKDVVHNVNCDQQYDRMHMQATLKDDCLNNRPE